VGRYLGIGIANMIAVFTPDRVVLGGGVAAAGDLLLEPIRAELDRRVRTTSLDEVTVVTAELGTLAGAIGSAVHGAEQAGELRWRRPRPGCRPVARSS
jgi:glucokinase